MAIPEAALRGAALRGAPLLGLAALLLAGCGSLQADDASGVRWTSVARVVEPEIVAPEHDPRVEHAAHRAALAQALGGPSLVFLRAPSAGHDRFFQQDDVWYLTGVGDADIGLALVVAEDGSVADEVLFLSPFDERFLIWEGERLAPGPAAEEKTGIRSTAPLPEEDTPAAWAALLAEHHIGGPLHVLPDTPGFDPSALQGMELGDGALRAALDKLRLVKSEYELACLQNAIDITCAGLLEAMAAARPGGWEYHAQAALEATFIRLGAERVGFPSICGAGINTVVLHYAANRGPLSEGDLLVMDVGAKYRYYCADVTRTIPVSGRFTPRQREIYELVLAAQTAAAQAARAGMTLRDVHAVAKGVLEEAGYAQYFMHGTSHWLGLDVHDVGGRVPIEIGSVFTIEPGIYIRDEALGVRIEDDYLMTADGAVKLSTGVPSDPDVLEALLTSLR